MLYQPAISQKFSLSVESGCNVTYLYTHSKYILTGNGAYTFPFPGYFNGLAGKYGLSEKSALKLLLQTEKRSVRQSLPFTDANNNSLGEGMFITSNNYINIGGLYVLRADKAFQIGIGINNHLLLFSTTASPSLNGQQINGNIIKSSHVRNYYFKTYNISIPIQVSLNGKRVYGFLTVDTGIFNRIRNTGGYMSQIEYSGQLGIGYKFKTE